MTHVDTQRSRDFPLPSQNGRIESVIKGWSGRKILDLGSYEGFSVQLATMNYLVSMHYEISLSLQKSEC